MWNFFFCVFFILSFSDWARPRIKFYILSFKNLIRESDRIEPPSAIFLSASIRSDISENTIICNLFITENLNSMVCEKGRRVAMTENT